MAWIRWRKTTRGRRAYIQWREPSGRVRSKAAGTADPRLVQMRLPAIEMVQEGRAPPDVPGTTEDVLARFAPQTPSETPPEETPDADSDPAPSGRIAKAAPKAGDVPLGIRLGGEPYRRARVRKLTGDPRNFYEERSTKAIVSRIEEVIDTEAPVALGVVARRLADAYGLKRLTTRLKDRVGVLLKEHIAIDLEDLARETSRLFGYRRFTDKVRGPMETGVRLLVERGGAKLDGSRVELP